MKHNFLVLSFAFILLFSEKSYSADGFWYPSDKEITEVPKFANEKKSDDFMRAVCVYGKAPLLKNPSASNTFNTMQFMTKAFVAANKNIDGQEFYLLVEKSNDNDAKYYQASIVRRNFIFRAIATCAILATGLLFNGFQFFII